VDSKQLFRHVKALNFKRILKLSAIARDTSLTLSQKLGWSPTLQPFEGGVNIIAQRQGTDPEAGAISWRHTTILFQDHRVRMTTLAGLPWFWKLPVFSVHAHATDVAISVFDQEELGLRGALPLRQTRRTWKTCAGNHGYGRICLLYTRLPTVSNWVTYYSVHKPGDFLAVVGDSEHLPLLEAFQKSTQAGLPPVLTLPVPLKGC